MRFTASIPDFAKEMAGAEEDIARSVTAGMREISVGLKDELREDVRKAGLGDRLANAWRGTLYPRSGASVEAAAYVYSNAPKIIDAFDRGVTITARNRRFLAIPTPDAGLRQTAQRRSRGSSTGLTPAAWERETGVKLRFVPGKSGGGVLVADAFYRRQAARFQRRKSFRPIKEGGPNKGRTFVVIFVLVRQARMRKRLDIDATAKRWADQIPSAVARNWVS